MIRRLYYPNVISEAFLLPNLIIHYFVVQINGTHIQSIISDAPRHSIKNLENEENFIRFCLKKTLKSTRVSR